MNTLTVNLHLLLASFFRPAGGSDKILIDAPTFPSDRYAVESQLSTTGWTRPSTSSSSGPRAGEVDRADGGPGGRHPRHRRPRSPWPCWPA